MQGARRSGSRGVLVYAAGRRKEGNAADGPLSAADLRPRDDGLVADEIDAVHEGARAEEVAQLHRVLIGEERLAGERLRRGGEMEREDRVGSREGVVPGVPVRIRPGRVRE